MSRNVSIAGLLAVLALTPNAVAQVSPAAEWAIHAANKYQVTPNVTYLTATGYEAKLDVYRRRDGTWQKYGDGGWSNTDRQPTRPQPTDRSTSGANRATPTDRGTIDQLNRDSAARREGSQRTRDYGSYRSGSGSHSGGSYRGGGGGSRGGGGFRGGGGRRR